jgi:DNA-binding transcriptional LysR family regulator
MKTRSRKPKKRSGSLSENVQIRRLDLNLFRVFDAVMQQRSVSKAAKALSVTPSAISHALVLLKLPYKPITVEVEMAWHQRVTRDPGFRWIREVLSSSAAEFAANNDPKT